VAEASSNDIVLYVYPYGYYDSLLIRSCQQSLAFLQKGFSLSEKHKDTQGIFHSSQVSSFHAVQAKEKQQGTPRGESLDP